MNAAQKELITKMNLVCTEKCKMNVSIDKAMEYVARNMGEYQRLTWDKDEED